MKKKRTGYIPDFPPKRLARCELAYRRRLARSLVHHFVNPAVDDPIGQDFEITNIFGPQIDFSGYNPEFSLPVANFKYGADTSTIQPAHRRQHAEGVPFLFRCRCRQIFIATQE